MTKDRAIANLIELKKALGEKLELHMISNMELKDSIEFAIQKIENEDLYKCKWDMIWDDSADALPMAGQVYHVPKKKYYHNGCKCREYKLYDIPYHYCPDCGEQMIFGGDNK